MLRKLPTFLLLFLAFDVSNYGQKSGASVNPPSPPTSTWTIMEPELDACDFLNGALGSADIDGDGVENCVDNCLFDPNKNQKDKNKDSVGDACEWRKRAEDEWQRTGQKQRRAASEPVDLRHLVKSSSVIVWATVHEGMSRDESGNSLGGWGRLNIIRQFKGKTLPEYPTVDGGIWVHFPDRGGPREFAAVGGLLYFLKDGKLIKWKEPQVYGGNIHNGKAYIETQYFGYQLADPKYGVLGVSEERLRLLEEIVKAPRRAP
jgi:hypothetical protein